MAGGDYSRGLPIAQRTATLYSPRHENRADRIDRRLSPAAVTVFWYAVPVLPDLLGLRASSHRTTWRTEGYLADYPPRQQMPSLA